MPREKKPVESRKIAASIEGLDDIRELNEEGGFKARAAVRQDFYDKLKDIADSLDVSPGSIIEARLRKFVEAEHGPALKRLRDLADARMKAAAESKG
jgi:hypothetical protein